MGSGCDKRKLDSDFCLNPVSDKCVLYTGPDIPILGICTGDRLSEIEEVILNKLLGYSSGEGIEISTLTANCDFVINALAGKDKDLSSLIQVLFDQNCTLYQLIKDLENRKENPYPFNFRCLITPPTPSRDQVIQSLINKVCELNNAVDRLLNPEEDGGDEDDGQSLKDTIEDITGNFIRSNIKACSNNMEITGWGKNTQMTLINQCPPGTVLFGNYDLTSFDPTGKGLRNRGFCGWALANGNNGTWDMRGLGASGATNIAGPPILPSVTIAGDSSTQTSVGSIVGLPKVLLTINHIPEHEHNTSQVPHTHTVVTREPQSKVRRGTAMPEGNVWQDHLTNVTKTTASSTVNISVTNIKNKTSNTRVDVRQPTRIGVWIQRVGPTYTVIDTGGQTPIDGGAAPII